MSRIGLTRSSPIAYIDEDCAYTSLHVDGGRVYITQRCPPQAYGSDGRRQDITLNPKDLLGALGLLGLGLEV